MQRRVMAAVCISVAVVHERRTTLSQLETSSRWEWKLSVVADSGMPAEVVRSAHWVQSVTFMAKKDSRND